MAYSQAEAAVINAAIAGFSPRSPLRGEGIAFATASNRDNIDWRFLVAIAGAETSFATYGPSQFIKNPFGMGPGIRYGSYSEAISAASRNLRQNYMDQGLDTVAKIQGKWAPGGAANDPTGLNSNWTRNVTRYLTMLGGNPSQLTRGDDSTVGGIRSIPGDAADVAGDAAAAVTGPIDALVSMVGRLLSAGVWLRVLAAVGGVVAIILSLVLLMRGGLTRSIRRAVG